MTLGSRFTRTQKLRRSVRVFVSSPDRRPRAIPEFFFQNWVLARSVLLLSRVSDLFLNISPLSRSLDFHLERHNLLASNVAHVDTPGYVPRDLERASATQFGAALDVAMERTSSTHLVGQGTALGGKVFEDRSAGGGADGNYVSLDREAAKVAANQLRYDLVSVLVKSKLQGLLDAAGDMQR